MFEVMSPRADDGDTDADGDSHRDRCSPRSDEDFLEDGKRPADAAIVHQRTSVVSVLALLCVAVVTSMCVMFLTGSFGPSERESEAAEEGVREAHKLLQIWCYGWITAVSTGLGAIPFLWVREMPPVWVGVSNGVAAGMMVAASGGLLIEGGDVVNAIAVRHHLSIGGPTATVLIGAVFGAAFVVATQRWLSQYEQLKFGGIEGLDARKALLLVTVMLVHSLSEGGRESSRQIGIGVSFGGFRGHWLGSFISITLALHNIPEGLAICLVTVPRGMSPSDASLWSIATSLPQPIMAIPAFLFVDRFEAFLPAGLGFAAGAMAWVAVRELWPEAREQLGSARKATMVAGSSALLMGLLQHTLRSDPGASDSTG